jgi:hypothetical protein
LPRLVVRMRPDNDRSRPAGNQAASKLSNGDTTIIPRPSELLADVDALAEHLRGRLVVQVEIDGDRYRTHVYRSTAAAERCVQRARDRGERSHVTLVQMLPVGVVVGLGGGGDV